MDQRGVNYVLRDYARLPLDVDELTELIGTRKPRDAVNVRSPSFRALKLELESIDDSKITEIMLTNQNIIHRPVLVAGETRITGFDPAVYASIGDNPNSE